MKVVIFLFLFVPSWALAKIQVAATTTDLAAIVKQVAGPEIEVFSICKGTQDPHQIEAKPSLMTKLRSVDLIVAHGLDLEKAWLDPLIAGARNPTLKDHVLELGPQLDPIEIPSGEITRALGDVHPGGNPHFHLDPERLGQAAILIAKKLTEIAPAQRDDFLKNALSLQKDLIEKTKNWQKRIKDSGVKEIITYHKTFSYFCSRFQIKCELQLEPKPGIPPTSAHLISIIDEIKRRNVRFVMIENLYDDSIIPKLKEGVPQIQVGLLPVSVEGTPDVRTNDQLIEKLVRFIEGKK